MPFDLNLAGTKTTSWTSPKGRSEFLPKITFRPRSAKTTKVSQESQDFIFTKTEELMFVYFLTARAELSLFICREDFSQFFSLLDQRQVKAG